MAEIDLIVRRLAELDERVVKIESLENGLWKLKEDMERSKREYLARRGAQPSHALPRRAPPSQATKGEAAKWKAERRKIGGADSRHRCSARFWIAE